MFPSKSSFLLYYTKGNGNLLPYDINNETSTKEYIGKSIAKFMKVGLSKYITYKNCQTNSAISFSDVTKLNVILNLKEKPNEWWLTLVNRLPILNKGIIGASS